MKLVLHTPLPRLANELCDVVKLFWPVEVMAVNPTAPLTATDAAKAQFTATPVTADMEPLAHTFTEENGQWLCAFTLRGQTATRVLPMPVAEDATATRDATVAQPATLKTGTTQPMFAQTTTGQTPEWQPAAEPPATLKTSTAQPVLAQTTTGQTPEWRPAAEPPATLKTGTAQPVLTQTIVQCAAFAPPSNIAQAIIIEADESTEDDAGTADPTADPDILRRKRLQKRLCKLTLYDLCKQMTGKQPPWGSLTGIRPTRLLYERLAQGMSLAAGAQALVAQFDVAPQKAMLLSRIVAVQQALPAPSAHAVDVYVSIPFCRTRCAYCSFPGEALGKGKQVEPYLQALFAEMDAAAALLTARGLTLRALYIGGGTPTALGEEAFAALLAHTVACFANPLEFTVEAGRPDTITQGKLRAMLAHGVTRISVNPQTMNDATLVAIGRDHTAAQTVEAFRTARALGFHDINMDVIAGLPGETPADFANTMASIAALSPDSLTVHTLAIKRSSRLHLTGATLPDADAVAAMVQQGEDTATLLHMEPYYLYRQKYMAGQQQNVGYARAGKACLYNVDIMEETTSILACGAGAISKRVFADRELRIERAPNVSNVAIYVQRAEDMIARKAQLFT